MKALPISIRKNGYNYTQINRGSKALIYRQEISSKASYYEVFLLRTSRERRIKDVLLPAKEIFPSNEAFGEWAWTFRDYKSAEWRFNELEKGLTHFEFTYPNSTRKKYS